MKSITKRRLKTRSIGRNTLNRRHKRRHSNRRWNTKQNKSRKKRMIGGDNTPPGSPRPPAPAGSPIFTGRRRRIQPESAPPPSTGWDCDCKKSDKPQTQTSTKQRSRANIGIKRSNITFIPEGIKLKKKMVGNILPQELHGAVIAKVDGYQLSNQFRNVSDDNERWKILEPIIERPEYESGNVMKLKKIVPDAAGGYSSNPNYEEVWIPIMSESLWKNNWREKTAIDKIQFIQKAEQQNNTNLLRDIGLFELNDSTKSHEPVVMEAIKGVLDDKRIDLEAEAEAEAEVDTTTTQVICDCIKPKNPTEPEKTPRPREIDV
jgi:hypothetical protein